MRTLQDIYNRCNAAIVEPTTYIKANENDEWKKAKNTETEMIKKNGTWLLVDRPANQKVIGVKKTKFASLLKLFYKLKQAPRASYERIDNYQVRKGPDSYVLNDFKMQMKLEFNMTDLGEMSYFLNTEFIQSPKFIYIHQSKELLKRFNAEACKMVDTPLVSNAKFYCNDEAPTAISTTYKCLIRSLLYLTASKLDIMYFASVLSRHMQAPSEIHFFAVKRVLRYIKGTTGYGLKFSKNESKELVGCCDSDWAKCLDDSKNTSGFCFSFGSVAFSWNFKKQDLPEEKTTIKQWLGDGGGVASSFNKLCTNIIKLRTE
ncbi:DNA/RNA polymerases superfamily protein [Theobroma cacao]|uniref:DNA/RNA polymerases superfamily protein n=1 Tax=Theobroma cacao TaxID=3641 RepID=A0A061FAH7_THECC|nr:DNA/RNA polymerases superfamily protein [Theobroma cacao]